jgi:expansin (peptidoglycan-binding protein)
VCGYPPETGNHMVVALDASELDGTAMCGACIDVHGPSGEATVLVVNGCPGCEVGHLDLSPEAYDLIAAGYNGVPPITWRYVPCDVTGPIRYAYYSGSSTTWAWVQVRNHRNPIAKLEARMAGGSFAELERSDWGYFKALHLPAGGQTYRVTDIYGQVLQDSGIAVPDEGEVDGKAQFPGCDGLEPRGGGSHRAGGAGCGLGAASGDGWAGGLGVFLLVRATMLRRRALQPTRSTEGERTRGPFPDPELPERPRG